MLFLWLSLSLNHTNLAVKTKQRHLAGGEKPPRQRLSFVDVPLSTMLIHVQAMELHGGMKHPAVLHLFIHLMELSAEPTTAMAAANTLRNLLPAAGHLTHMASHIDIWAGHYKVTESLNCKGRKNAMTASRVGWGARSCFPPRFRVTVLRE